MLIVNAEKHNAKLAIYINGDYIISSVLSSILDDLIDHVSNNNYYITLYI